MNSTQLLVNIQNEMHQFLAARPLVKRSVELIKHAGGESFLVGGAVRDILFALQFGTSYKLPDIDIEVHNVNIEKLAQVLSTQGHVNYVGKSFGVLKIDHTDIDWSLPRTDSSGRKPDVTLVPDMGIENALRRRDVTINAMAINLHTYELIDPFGGYKDLTNKILRSPDVTFFTQDPLRFYRIMQFIGRFTMQPDNTLQDLCSSMDIRNVSIERIENEFEKLLLKSTRPSLGIRWLLAIGRLSEILPELNDAVGIPQEPIWHPEGDVFEHSMQALDAAAVLTYKDETEKLICTYAALCHDLGKVTTTKLIDGKLRSRGHDEAGVPLAHALLKRISTKKQLIKTVGMLVKKHMQPLLFIRLNAGDAAYRRLAHYLSGYATIDMLAKVSLADRRGRNPLGTNPLSDSIPDIDAFIDKAHKLNIYSQAVEPLLYGRDIVDRIKPGPEMGKVLAYAYKTQLETGITDKETLKAYVFKKLKNIS